MKILHISKYYYPYIGGVENICKYLVERMPWHETSVMCFNDGASDCVDEIAGHKVYRAGVVANIVRQAVSYRYGKVLKKALNEKTPDIIQYHWANPFPALFLRMIMPRNSRLVVHWHMDIIRQWYLYWAVRPWEKWLINRADRIVVTSPNYRDGSKPLQQVKDKVRVVPNCIEEDNLKLREGDTERIEAIRSSYGGKPIVLFVGRHTRYKGLPHLINAEQYMQSDCAIVIAGNGPLTQKLKAQTQVNNSKRIHFTGRLTEDDLRCYLHAASVFAFPSVTKNEAFGVALAEAMYCYTPAVTFTIDGSGVNWVNLHKVTGIEVAQDAMMDEHLAQAIDRLVNDSALRQQYAEAAHQRVKENFLTHHMVDAMERVYKEITE